MLILHEGKGMFQGLWRKLWTLRNHLCRIEVSLGYEPPVDESNLHIMYYLHNSLLIADKFFFYERYKN